MNLTGRVALVTGGSGGIGRAVCVRLAEAGATVAVGHLDGKDRALDVVATMGRGMACRVDIASYDDAVHAVESVIGEYGRLDVLVNNAAVGTASATALADVREWARIVHTNLVGSLHCVRAAALHMLVAGQGSIVNVSSIAALSGIAGLGGYAASKAGLLGLTRAVAKEFAPHGVRVNAVAPGYTANTGMGDLVGGERLQALTERIPMARLARPKEIADAVAFLASDESTYITGHTLVVDGGLTA